MVQTANRLAEPMQIDVNDIEAAGRAATPSGILVPEHVARSNYASGRSDSGEPSIFAIAAPIRKVTTRANAQLLELAKARAFAPDLLDEAEPFFWGAEISSSRVDAYFTRMARSTLKNFAAGAAAGVSFQNSHNTRELGIGYSLTGSFKNGGGIDDEENPMRVEASFYTVPGLQAGPLSTDMFIKGVLYGLYRDVSVGFYGGTMRCSICGRDLWDWDCWHIPGEMYKQVDPETGDPTGDEELAIFWIEDAYLAEVSVVYDGATPGAAILKAEQEAQAGRIKASTARMIEARYRVKLPGAERIFAGVEISSPPKEDQMGTQAATRDPAGAPAPATDDAQPAAAAESVEATATDSPVSSEDAARAAIAEIVADDAPASTEGGTEQRSEDAVAEPVAAASDPAPADPAPAPAAAAPVAAAPNPGENAAPTTEQRAAIAAVTQPEAPHPDVVAMAGVRAVLREVGVPETADPVTSIRRMAQRILTLIPQAKDGERYRADLIEETLAEGVRAFGNTWDVEMYRGMLQALSLDHIKRMRDDYAVQGRKNFPGGRVTTDAATEPASEPEQRAQVDDLWDKPLAVPNGLFA